MDVYGPAPFHAGCTTLSRHVTAGASTGELSRFFELSFELLCVGGLEDGYFKHLNPSWERVLG